MLDGAPYTLGTVPCVNSATLHTPAPPCTPMHPPVQRTSLSQFSSSRTSASETACRPMVEDAEINTHGGICEEATVTNHARGTWPRMQCARVCHGHVRMPCGLHMSTSHVYMTSVCHMRNLLSRGTVFQRARTLRRCTGTEHLGLRLVYTCTTHPADECRTGHAYTLSPSCASTPASSSLAATL